MLLPRASRAEKNMRASGRTLSLWLSRPERFWLIALIATKAAIGLVVYLTGFVAISDDDYARVVIAQQFAERPSWDPSGTSWLPLPFWIYGSSMLVFGGELAVARAVAFAIGIGASVLLYQAARHLGMNRPTALSAAVIASAFPYSARLGIATVPEVLTAALIVLGICHRRRTLGALSLAAACLCRYEAWPVAWLFSAVCVYDWYKRPRQKQLLLAAFLAVSSSLWWMAHGFSSHGDALFFVTRVRDYHEALGGQSHAFGEIAVDYASALVRFEPELFLLSLVVWAVLFHMGQLSGALAGFSRPALLLCGLFVFLIMGKSQGSAATHHPERALLAFWFLLSFSLARALSVLAANIVRQKQVVAMLALGSAVLGIGVLIRSSFGKLEPFAQRAHEEQLGHSLKAVASASERVVVETPDYGYFAVIAGFGRPGSVRVLNAHDPRTPAAAARENLAQGRAALAKASYLVTTETRRAQVFGTVPVLQRAGSLVLLRLTP